MKRSSLAIALCALAALVLTSLAPAQPGPRPQQKKRVMAVGMTEGFYHDSTTEALATIKELGDESGLWETYIYTDIHAITKLKQTANKKNLDQFDAIFFMTTGELPFTDEQKASFLSFIKDEGKGFVGAHCATDTFYKWPEYGEMLGGYFDQHPWGTFDAPVVVEDPTHPLVKHFPKEMTLHDEIYQFKDWDRNKLRVLMALDASKLDLAKKNVHRTDRDFAVTWVKKYGNGRVFYSTLGHTIESWRDPRLRKMWLEGMRWALKLGPDVPVTPIPKP
ncbi:MAG: ThuA domain-containing protein [Bryobacterales bacterium]|nr:ThuA domain-containing protein [Bryobacterales bacterium]